MRLQPPGDVWIDVDRARLVQVLMNLLTNALEAVDSDEGLVRVKSYYDAEGRATVIEVVDNGPGIAAALSARVFEPFVSGRPGGTGLGLAVARGIVERHGGELRLADSNTGCRFELSLPAHAVRPAITTPVAA